MTEDTIEKLDPIMTNGYPFLRKKMKISEFEEEKMYWWTHLQEVKDGTYKPLWKQREEASK